MNPLRRCTSHPPVILHERRYAMEESLEVVYYTSPAPSSWQALATLALVFDRIHFPGVYMGTNGLDRAATLQEIERIASGLRSGAVRQITEDDRLLLNCMLVAAQHKHLKEFCVFPGTFDVCGTLEPGAEKLLMELEQLYFGPPDPGFHPTPNLGFARGLPGEEKAGINAPSWLSYPANAFLYATRLGLPYVNDDPRMPMLGPPQVVAKNDPKLLSIVLAIECVQMALPPVKPLTSAEEVQELRERTRPDVQPFRQAMLKFTKDVNAAIRSESSMEEVVDAARLVAKSQVEPALEELRQKLRDPARHWTQRLIDFTVPATILLAGSSDVPDMIRRVLAAALIPLGREVMAQRAKAKEIRRTGLHFLLKLQGK